MSNAVAFDEKFLIEEIKKLPTEKVTEVFDFVEFLRDREGGVEDDPSVQAQVQEARVAYQSGDYMTIDEYITQRSLHI